jgi:hypothetical protein
MEQGERRMTKEELKQEAEVYSYKLYHSKAWNPGEDMLVKAYLAGAEPREKRIAELEQQIEKMKCCFNCKHSRTEYEHCKTDKSEKWEIKEK